MTETTTQMNLEPVLYKEAIHTQGWGRSSVEEHLPRICKVIELSQDPTLHTCTHVHARAHTHTHTHPKYEITYDSIYIKCSDSTEFLFGVRKWFK